MLVQRCRGEVRGKAHISDAAYVGGVRKGEYVQTECVS